MKAFSGDVTKFLCPKCKQYYDANQRFCPKDGTRLLPGITHNENKTQNIFTKALARQSATKELKREPIEEQGEKEIWKAQEIKEDADSILEIDIETLEQQTKKQPTKVINPLKIPSGTAEVGNRSIKPLGREPFTAQKPRILIGKTLKGRYQITNFIKQNQKNFVYLADDLITKPLRKVLVYIFLEHNLSDKILADERISLSHIEHPHIASMIDSGSLQEGNLFIVVERPQGETLETRINQRGHIELSQIAKIVRQIAEALNEAHRNRILHRNLTPRNIFLTVNEKGVEQVKVAEFAVSEGDDPSYLSPEQIEGKAATSASDIFSLGVITYQLLTKRLPFQAESKKQVLELQKAGLKITPSQLRVDVPSSIDNIIQKALAYEPSNRFSFAREFGDLFYNALVQAESESETKTSVNPTKSNQITSSSVKSSSNPLLTQKIEILDKAKNAKLNKSSRLRPLLPILSLITFLSIAAISLYLPIFNRPITKSQNSVVIDNKAPQNNAVIDKQPHSNSSLYFRNLPENLTEELAKNYRDFSFFYPNDWRIYPNKSLFVDVAKKNKDGIPIEQFLVTFYRSKGNLQDDRPTIEKLLNESNEKLAKQLPNYRFISQKEAEFAGMKAYQMNFEATQAEKDLKIFGKRIFLPSRAENSPGLIITMIATSLSSDIKSAEDVGVKGEMKTIVQTFKIED
ncbi:MAG: serine/threonine protein kinase [Acidobacteria bacterium]|nr:MAG: serine/threonine protein kinase [Acidobacteriota bacterium]